MAMIAQTLINNFITRFLKRGKRKKSVIAKGFNPLFQDRIAYYRMQDSK